MIIIYLTENQYHGTIQRGIVIILDNGIIRGDVVGLNNFDELVEILILESKNGINQDGVLAILNRFVVGGTLTGFLSWNSLAVAIVNKFSEYQ